VVGLLRRENEREGKEKKRGGPREAKKKKSDEVRSLISFSHGRPDRRGGGRAPIEKRRRIVS